MQNQLLCSGVHPRLLYFESDVQNLKKQLETDASLRDTFAGWKQASNALLEKPWLTEEYADSVYSQHGRYYEIGDSFSDLALRFGLLYQLTGERVYAEKLKDGMLHYAAFRCWTGPANKDRDTPWTSDLTTTRILYAFAVAYDCIYDTLSPAERETIRAAMLKNGIRPLLSDWVLPGKRIHALDSMGHNWWSVCISLAAVGLCSVYEDVPEADAWMEQIFGALHGFCTYAGEILLNKTANFDDKGLFYESANYFNYGISELMRFAFVYARLFENGKERTQFESIDRVPQAFMAMSYPTSNPKAPLLFPNFGDSKLTGGFTALPQFLLLWGCDDPAIRYAYHTYKTEPDLFDFLYPQLLGGAFGTLEKLPESMVFDKSGYAYLRTSWEKDATLLAVRCGYTWNHAHDDAGHFMLFADGEPVIPDAGNCSYDLPEYGGYYKTCEAHNIVTINGHAQREDALFRGSKFPGTLSHFIDGEMKYLLADATGPTCDSCNRNYRSFLWLCPDVLVTVDDLRTHAPAEFASLFHCVGEGKPDGNRIRVQGKTPLSATVLFPDTVEIETRIGYLPPENAKGTDPDAKPELPRKAYYAFKAGEKTDVMQFVSFYGLHDAADLIPEKISGKNWIGLRFAYEENSYEVAYNLLADGRKMHENSNNTLLGFETDAYLLAVRRAPGGKETVLMVYGSYLRRDGQSLYESFTKDFTEFTCPGRKG